ncbi:hypothetical protein CLV78_102730 [Aliiruegeria haliotis]|uniref:Uncharacterized protein n=1 Tax=Aliiruegeria haliotis TaxID=1280846 RepID=A0A2T0RWM1_9RHOB|nr:hypothetical protein CLV78_102730 [Aliiruegeria haliotis]
MPGALQRYCEMQGAGLADRMDRSAAYLADLRRLCTGSPPNTSMDRGVHRAASGAIGVGKGGVTDRCTDGGDDRFASSTTRVGRIGGPDRTVNSVPETISGGRCEPRSLRRLTPANETLTSSTPVNTPHILPFAVVQTPGTCWHVCRTELRPAPEFDGFPNVIQLGRGALRRSIKGLRHLIGRPRDQVDFTPVPTLAGIGQSGDLVASSPKEQPRSLDRGCSSWSSQGLVGCFG